MPPSFPDLPNAHHADVDSMLARKFGKEVANYFSGAPLNRVSFLRTDQGFLSAALKHESTRFLLFRRLAPLTSSPGELTYVSYADVKPIIGEDPYAADEKDMLEAYNSSTFIPQLIFLGLDSRNGKVTFKDRYKGSPIFALDITPQPEKVKESMAEQADALAKRFEADGHKFAEGRMNTSLPAQEASIYAVAKHLLDWNARNPYCAQCGSSTISVNAGWKRACPPKDWASLPAGALASAPDAAAAPRDRPGCATRMGVSNLSFPRTDPTVIMAVVSSCGQKILLGRQKRWPPYFYSTLAGFLEPGESVEEAVRREVWEESGITLGRVVIHSTQPWPYPANLMIGAIGQATPDGETIDLGHDAELEDAKWWTLEEVREALRAGVSGINPGDRPSEAYKEGSMRLPPPTAIANQLIESVSNGGFLSGVTRI